MLTMSFRLTFGIVFILRLDWTAFIAAWYEIVLGDNWKLDSELDVAECSFLL